MMKMLARLVLSSFSHRPYDSKVLTASTSPNWQQMSLSVSQLQLFLEQLLTDIWVSSPQGSTLKHIEDYIFTLWLQETFYNFYPFLRPFIFIILLLTFGPCLIFSSDSSKTESQPFPKTKSRLLLLETLKAKIENRHYGPWTSFLPDHKPLTLIYQHEETLNITGPTSLFVYIP